MSYQQMNHNKRHQTAKQSNRTGQPADIITFTDGAGHVIPIEPGDVLEEDDSYYETRPPTSVIRRSAGNAPAQPRVQVEHHYYDQPYQQDFIKRQSRTAPHAPPAQQQPPYDDGAGHAPHRPGTRGRQRQKIKFHWLVFLGIGLFLMIASWKALSDLGAWWQTHQDDATYGNPRTFQIDAVVGHFDSPTHPTHFIAMNLKGQVIVIELPGGDTSKARSYDITTIPDNTANPPVRLLFQDLTHDGKLDMVIEIGDPGSTVTIFFYNNGAQFVPKL